MRCDPPETRQHEAANEENGRIPRIAADGYAAGRDSVLLTPRHRSCPDLDARRQQSGFRVAPQCDQQLTRHRDDGDAPCATLQGCRRAHGTKLQGASRLIAQPQPGELDEGCASSRVASPPDAPVAIHASALMRHRCDADIAGKLTPVVEAAVEHLPHEHGRDVLANAPDALKEVIFWAMASSGAAARAADRSVSISRISSSVRMSRRRRRLSSARNKAGSPRPSPVRSSVKSRSHERSDGRARMPCVINSASIRFSMRTRS